MAGTTKAAEKAVQEPTEAKAEAKVYNLRSSNKYLTVSSLGVQFMAGQYTTTDPAVARALLEIDDVELIED